MHGKLSWPGVPARALELLGPTPQVLAPPPVPGGNPAAADAIAAGAPRRAPRPARAHIVKYVLKVHLRV